MAVTGTYTNNFRTGYAIQLVWTVDSQNITNNTSNVTAKVQLVSTGASYTINSTTTKNGTLTINGTSYSFTFSAALSGNQTKTLFTKSVTISHNADGSKTCAFSCSAGINVTLSGTYYGNVTASGSGTFNTIPRATTPTLSASSVALGNVLTITATGASSSFNHTLTYSIGTLSGTIQTGLTGAYNWTIPKTIANAITSATSGIVTITCKTFNGSTLIGTKSVTVTATIPDTDEFKPTISNVAIAEATTGLAAKFNAYIQNKSKLDVSITAAGAYGSTISKYETYIQAVPYHGSSFISNIITTSGTIGVLTTVTDSRGRTKQVNNTVTIIAYTAPTISAFTAYRANSSGAQDYEGANLKIEFNFSISPVNNLNDKSYEIVYRLKGASEWTTLTSGSVYSLNTSIISNALFNPDNAYDLAINIADYFSGASATLDIPTAFTLIDLNASGKGIAFGKVSEKDRMEIALDVELTKTLVQEDKKAPTLLNSWVNYGTAYESASYWKDSCGVVRLAGLIKGGTTTAETVIFTLPAGYRPQIAEKFFAVSLNAICVIDVYANGNVAIKTGANAGWLSLSGISFKAGG